MGRIDGVSARKIPLWLRPIYWLTRRAVAKVTGNRGMDIIEPLTIMAHRRWLMSAFSFFELGLQRSHSMELKVKELARLKASSAVGCTW